MASSKRFWCCIIICIVLHLALVECKKIDDFKSIALNRCKRDTFLNESRKVVDFTSAVVLGGISIPLSNSNPLFMIVSVFAVGTLVDLMWPVPNSYQPISANVISDIRKEMNKKAVKKMKMKLRAYGIQIRTCFSALNVPRSKVEQWENSVLRNGLSLNRQYSLLQEYKHLNEFNFFKDKIKSLASDVDNDRHTFHIQNDPTSSLAYYREFVTLHISLWVVELMIYAATGETQHLKQALQKKIKITLQDHYKYVMLAIHKSATLLESKHKSRLKYKEVVNSWYEQIPLETWKQLTSYSGQSRYIQSSDAVLFKYIDLDDRVWGHRTSDSSSWMNCWGLGTKCSLGNCPGIDNPFDAGEEHQYNYHCREEVFWIYAEKYQYIRACDKVAIHYNSWGDKHYWLSLDYRRKWGAKLWFFKTRTCPGTFFMYEPFNGRCRNEILTIEVEGKTCGELIEDRDAIVLKDKNNGYVSNSWRELVSGQKTWWRIFKHDSLLKSVHNDFMK